MSTATNQQDLIGAQVAQSPSSTGPVVLKQISATSTGSEHALVANLTAVGFTTANVLSLRHLDTTGGCSAVRFLDPTTGNEYGAMGFAASGFAGGLFNCTYIEGSDVVGSGSGKDIAIIHSTTYGGTKSYGPVNRLRISSASGGTISIGNSLGTNNICQFLDGYLKVGTTGATGQIQVSADSGFTTGGIRFLNNAGSADGMLAEATDGNIYLLAGSGGGGNQFNILASNTATAFTFNCTTGTLTLAVGYFILPKTITAGGTTGARTIDKPTGSVNFAASAASLVVTNALVTANSVIQATVATNDTTMKSVQAVAGSGSFTLYPNALPTAETRVNFSVTN